MFIRDQHPLAGDFIIARYLGVPRVQLWQCYWRHGASPTSFVESWDFGTWLHAIKSGAKFYPLFLGSGNFSVDADDHALGDGLGTVSVSMINHYTVSWEYWY